MTERSRNIVATLLIIAALAGSATTWYLQWPILAVGIFGCSYSCVAWQVFRTQRFWRLVFSGLLLVVGAPALLTGLHQLRCRYQPQPAPIQTTLFEGVEYTRAVLQRPQPAVIHILKIDLTTEGVEVLVTPPDFPEQTLALKARTTSTFLEEFELQAAINGANFFPFERRNPLSYTELTAEAKGVLGGAASRGAAYGEPSPYYPILHITPDNLASILHQWPETPYTATAGIKHFIKDGVPIDTPDSGPSTSSTFDAFTAVGIDQTGRVLFLMVADGDQPPYSAGVARSTLSEVLLSHGVHDALGLDGGGSSTMVIEDKDGSARRLNRPVQGEIPGIERPVGNHIGIYARRLGDR